MIALDRAAAYTRIREIVDGKAAGDADKLAGEIMEGLTASGWVVLRPAEAPMKRVVLTLMPDGTPYETVEISGVSWPETR